MRRCILSPLCCNDCASLAMSDNMSSLDAITTHKT